MLLSQVTPSTSELSLRLEVALLFYKTGKRLSSPVAVLTGDVVYYPATTTPAIQRAVNAWYKDSPHCLVNPAEFRFVLGSALTTTGLPLTRLRAKETDDAKSDNARAK